MTLQVEQAETCPQTQGAKCTCTPQATKTSPVRSAPNPLHEAAFKPVNPCTSGSAAAGVQQISGWYYCWNRMYDPQLGRFTSPDPAASPWSNLTDYTYSSPAIRTDPSGLYSTWQDGIAGVLQRLLKAMGIPAEFIPRDGVPTHNSITKDAMRHSTRVPSCIKQEVLNGSFRIDNFEALGGYANTKAFHVDDTRTLPDTEAWIRAVREAGKTMTSCCCLPTLARLAGMGAHTIQDFYHHSDWFYKHSNGHGGFQLWDETSSGASDVSVGSGWQLDSSLGGNSRVGPWHHDPYGDMRGSDDSSARIPGDVKPFVGGQKTGLDFLRYVTPWVTTHTSMFLGDVLGSHKHCCHDQAEAGSVDFGPANLRRCFGAAGSTISQFVNEGRGTEGWYKEHGLP